MHLQPLRTFQEEPIHAFEIHLRILKCFLKAFRIAHREAQCGWKSLGRPRMPPQMQGATKIPGEVRGRSALSNQTSNQTSGGSLVSWPRLPRFGSFPFRFPFRGEKGSALRGWHGALNGSPGTSMFKFGACAVPKQRGTEAGTPRLDDEGWTKILYRLHLLGRGCDQAVTLGF